MNLVTAQVCADAEPVNANVFPEELSNLLVITRIRERGGEMTFQLHFHSRMPAAHSGARRHSPDSETLPASGRGCATGRRVFQSDYRRQLYQAVGRRRQSIPALRGGTLA